MSEGAALAVNGCRHCGVDARDHAQRWFQGVGWHGHVEPTDAQRLDRLRENRALRLYAWLLDSGLSEYESRETAWPSQAIAS